MGIQELNIDVLPKIKKLPIFTNEKAYSEHSGEWVSSSKGQGLEFAGYRNYMFGDDARLIDWKASIRSKELVIREFQEERLLNLIIMLDVSNSMLFSSHKKTKAEIGGEIAINIANGVLNSGDAVGMIMFNEKVVTKIFPDTGKNILKRIIEKITDKEIYGGGYDLNEAFKYVIKKFKGHALLVIISDFIGLKENWYKWLTIASGLFEVVGICLRDPRDLYLPKKHIELWIEDPLSGEKRLIDVYQYADEYNKKAQEQLERVKEGFSKTKAGFLLIDTKKDYLEPLLKFFFEKYRR